MARLFWVGVGAVATVVAISKGRKAVRKYLPEEVAARAQARAGEGRERVTAAITEFRKAFGEAQTRREAELREALLASGQRVATTRRLAPGWNPTGLITAARSDSRDEESDINEADAGDH